MKIVAGALALLLIATPALAQSGPGIHANGPVAAPEFFAKHVTRMAERHPGVKLEVSGYQYLSSGTVVTGEQVRVPGGIFSPCWYLATFAADENGPARMTSASCKGNG